MGKGTEGPSRAVAILLDIVAFGRLVDFRMELLLRAGVAILTRISAIAVTGLSPFIPMLHVRASSRPLKRKGGKKN